MEKLLSIEQIDKHVEKNLSATSQKVIDAKFDLCTFYTTARPVIIFANALLFFKPKWQEVVSNLIAALDKVCPLK